MANYLDALLGGAANGGSFTAQSHRIGMVSHATTMGGASGLLSRSGIVPTVGSPLAVTALGTPAMKVDVAAGTCIVQSSSGTGGVYSVTLLTAGQIDITAAHATLPRIDVVVAEVVDDGVAAPTAKIKVIDGTPNASPTRASTITSPPANTTYVPLKQITVAAAVSTITSGAVTATSADGLYTASVGGVVVVKSWAEGATLPVGTTFYATDTQSVGVTKTAGARSIDPVPVLYQSSWFGPSPTFNNTGPAAWTTVAYTVNPTRTGYATINAEYDINTISAGWGSAALYVKKDGVLVDSSTVVYEAGGRSTDRFACMKPVELVSGVSTTLTLEVSNFFGSGGYRYEAFRWTVVQR